jgi:hypothetical protein
MAGPSAKQGESALSLSLEALAAAFRDALCGPKHLGSPEVVWSDGGSQVVLHVGKLQVRTVQTALVVAVDTESSEFGVAPLVVRFVFGKESGPASLVAATDETALGHPQVAARWGPLFRDVVWAAFARQVELAVGGQRPAGISVGRSGLQLAVDKPVSIVELAGAHVRDLVSRGLREAPRQVQDREPPA